MLPLSLHPTPASQSTETTLLPGSTIARKIHPIGNHRNPSLTEPPLSRSRVLVLSALSQRTHSPPNSRSAWGVHSPDTIERLGLSRGRGCVPDVVLALNEILKICAQERSYLLSTYNMPSGEMHATGNLGKSGRRKEGKKGRMKIEEAFSRARRSG